MLLSVRLDVRSHLKCIQVSVQDVDLRKWLWNTAGWYGGDDLLPDKGAQSKEDAPDPLLQGQGGSGEGDPAELYDDDLEQKKHI